MALAIGFLLFLLGAVTFYAWLPATFYFLQGVVSCSLMLWGLLALLVGTAQRKAKRELARAMHDEDSLENTEV